MHYRVGRASADTVGIGERKRGDLKQSEGARQDGEWGAGDLPPMLPDPEITAFLMTIGDAVDFVSERQLADGYAVLVAGLRLTQTRPREASRRIRHRPAHQHSPQ
jgi:hypothetical protein